MAAKRNQQPATANLWTPGARSIHTPVPLGVYEDGNIAELAVWNSIGGRNIFLTGAIGSGKTNKLNVLLAGIFACTDTVVWVIDVAKRGKSLAPWLPCIDWLATDPATAVEMLACVNAVIDARALAGARLAATGDGDAVLAPSSKLPLLVVVIDEASALFGRNTADAADATEQGTQVAETGREVAVSSIIATQKPTQDSLGHSGRLKSQLNPVLCLRMNRVADLRWAMTNAPTESLTLDVFTAPGVTLLQDGPDSSPLPLRSYALYQPAVVAKLAQLYAPHRAQLDATSRLAAGPAYAQRNRDPLGINADATANARRSTGQPEGQAVVFKPRPHGKALGEAKAAYQTARQDALRMLHDAETAPLLAAQPLAALTAAQPPIELDDDGTEELLLDVLSKADGELTRAQIQKAADVSKATACRVLAGLARQGKVKRASRNGRHLYHLPSAKANAA